MMFTLCSRVAWLVCGSGGSGSADTIVDRLLFTLDMWRFILPSIYLRFSIVNSFFLIQ